MPLDNVKDRLASLAHEHIRSLEPYKPGKPLETVRRELGLTDIIKLASNENPLGPGELARRAMAGCVEHVGRYPDGSANDLKQMLSGCLEVDPEWVTIGNGSNEILELLARVFVAPTHDVVFSRHAFAVYAIVTQAVGASSRIVPAIRWGHDLEAMASAVGERTRLVFVANPNNPTGTWVGEQELVRFIEALPDHVLVVLDEAYCEYVTETAYPDGVRLLERYPNLIVTRTFSKVHGLAGLRVGYAVSHPSIAELLNRARQPFNVNCVAMAAACAALRDDAHVARSIEMNAKGMAQLTKGVAALGLDWIASVANFVTVDLGRPAEPVYRGLLERGVIVRPIGVYDMPEHLRVTVGTAAENARFLEALGAVLDGA